MIKFRAKNGTIVEITEERAVRFRKNEGYTEIKEDVEPEVTEEIVEEVTKKKVSKKKKKKSA